MADGLFDGRAVAWMSGENLPREGGRGPDIDGFGGRERRQEREEGAFLYGFERGRSSPAAGLAREDVKLVCDFFRWPDPDQNAWMYSDSSYGE